MPGNCISYWSLTAMPLFINALMEQVTSCLFHALVCERERILFINVFSSLLAQHPVGRGRTVFLKAMKNI